MKSINFDISRRFGVEIEICSFDGKRKVDKPELPKGIEYVASKVAATLQQSVDIRPYGIYDSKNWIIKPDGSCGMELCSPPLKGTYGLKEVYKVVNLFKNNYKILADENCSFHVHIDVGDLKKVEIASVIAWWIKCEPVILDAMVFHRKMNRYCQMVGFSDALEHDINYQPGYLIHLVGDSKYYSINSFNYIKDEFRKTLEVRVMGENACKNPLDAYYWIMFILYFFDRAIKKGMPKNYDKNDRFSGLLWLEPVEVLDFLGFDQDLFLSKEMKEVKNWLITSWHRNCHVKSSEGFWSASSRHHAISQIRLLYSTYLGSYYNK